MVERKLRPAPSTLHLLPSRKPAKPGGAAKKAAVSPKSAGRKLGGNRNGGGAAPGTGQGQAPRTGRPKST